MPADIRNFFGGGSLSSQEKPASATKTKAQEKTTKGRGKRRILSDSEDEAVDTKAAKHATPGKAEKARSVKKESPKGEATTTSDYFAASGKVKPSRSTPTKPKRESAHASSPKQANGKNKKPAAKGAASSRSKRKPTQNQKSYAEEDAEDDDDADFEDGDFDAMDLDDADFENAANSKRTPTTRKNQKEETPVRNGHGPPTPASKTKVPTRTREGDKAQAVAVPAKGSPGSARSKKRSSAHLEEDDEDGKPDHKPSAKKPKSTPKKPDKQTAADATPSKSAVDDIFDSIPVVKPPTPPARDESKKFDWRTAQRKPEPVASSEPAELPEGAENCLAGLTFVFTGILESLDRDAGIELVKRYGGKVTGAPSRKTNFVILGTDAGPKKLETIRQHGLRTIDEMGLFELIRKLPANGGDSEAAEKFAAKKKKEEEDIQKAAEEMEKHEQAAAKKTATPRSNRQATTESKSAPAPTTDDRLWTVKYAPSAATMICGNKTQVEKLQSWLRAWPNNMKFKFKKPGKDGSGTFRAIILHGPPGIGKTTAAHLAAKLEGYDIVESNASDTRSKKLMETSLKGVLDTTSLLGYFAGDGKQVEKDKKKLVLIMDEVDGMSAGDRGGVGAMAAVCRKTRIPIILICNDRRQPKMKPFDSVAYDLPFRRPTVDQIRQRMMTICFREKLKIPPNVINALIEGSNADIRQIINMLSAAKLDQDAMDFDQGKKMSKSWEKNIILKPWDIVSKILNGGMFASSSNATLNDKIELYFNDHEFSSLMLQENYLGTKPMLANGYSGKEHNLKILEVTEKAASSISDGDLVDRMIHGSQQQWALMPTHAIFSFVRPASFVAGSSAGHQTRFTSWLGQNSKMGKLMRFIKEIQGHMRLHSSGDRHEVRQQYFSILWYFLVKRLQMDGKEAVPEIIELMDSYFLTKEDWDAILELGVGPMDMESIKIDTQAKSAFTRTYNQQPHPVPYIKASQIVAPKKKDKDRPDLEEAMDESDSGAESGDDQPVMSDDEPLDLKKDKYVKAPKKSAAGKGKAAKGGKAASKAAAAAGGEDEFIDDESEDNGKSKAKSKGKGSKGKGKK